MNETRLYWVGIDVSAPTFDAAVASPGQHANTATFKELPAATFDRTPEGVRAFMGWLRKHVPSERPLPVRAVMEATGMYSIELTALLCKACPEMRPAIANPERTTAFRKSLGLRNKTDRIDARALALFGLERQPDPYEPLSPVQAELRNLSRCRDDLIETQKAHQNQLIQSGPSPLVRKTLKHVIATIRTALKKIEEDMKRVIESDEGLRHDYNLLTSIPGVGFVTACVVLAEFGDLRRFGCARQIGAHAGLTAFHYDSGNQRPPAHMSKKGNAYVRKVLYMSAISASRHNPPLRVTYRRMIAVGKEPMVALGALMRKLLVLMRALVVTGNPFDPCGKPRRRVGQHA
jgi:transposase